MKKKIINWLTEYKETTNAKGVVLGISGGKDSTVVAMLSKLVFGDDVFGVIMPNGIQKDIDDAIKVCETLHINYRIVNINDAYKNLLDSIEYCPGLASLEITDKAKTNIPPRLRMTTLYAIAQTLGYRVIGTGNASERYIGWFTKYGDGGVDINPLAHLDCFEVVKLGYQLMLEDYPELEEDFYIKYLAKLPADGLTGKTDEDNFGFTYLDLTNYMTTGTSGKLEIDEKIKTLHTISEHKLKMPYTLLESGKLID